MHNHDSSNTISYCIHNYTDIDECEIDPSLCRDVCVNTYGTYHCDCFVGYILNDDGVSCRGIDIIKVILLCIIMNPKLLRCK